MVWKALFGKPEQPPVSTIADLRAAIDGLPDDLPIFVLRAGHTAGWVFESLDLPGKSGEHQLRNQEVFYGKREQTDAGVSA